MPSVLLEFHQKWPPGFRAQLLRLSCAHRFKIRPSILIIFIPTVICRLHCSLPAEVVVSYAPFLFHQKRPPLFESLFSGLFIGSTAPSFRKETLTSRKIWRYRTVVFRFGKRSGSIALNLLKGNPSENLVLSDRCLLWKTQRFDSTKFLERKPFRNFGAVEPLGDPFPVIFDH